MQGAGSRWFAIVVALQAALAVAPAHAELVPGDCPPEDLTVILNTGWDEDAEAEIASGDPDDDWDVIVDAALGPVPSDAGVLNPSTAWLTLPDSQWIASTASSWPNGLYVYETCWCMDDNFTSPLLTFAIRADDQADVRLNGFLVASLPTGTFNDPTAPGFRVNDPAKFFVGLNCLTVHVQQQYGGPHGFNLQGSVTAVDGRCCGCYELPPDAEAWWRLDETSGTTAFDSVSGHDGTHVGSPAPALGHVAGSLLFDGTTQYVQVPDEPGLDFDGDDELTIDAWIQTTTFTREPIVNKRKPNFNAPGYLFGVSGGLLLFEIADGTTTVSCNGTGIVNDGDWHFVAVTLDRDPAEVRLYIDGLPDLPVCDPSPAGSLVNDESLAIGNNFPGNFMWWDGKLDEIEIFRRALTATEILNLKIAGGAGKCPPTPCQDSTGEPVCEGTCPAGQVCETGPPGGPDCDCVPERVLCTDSSLPVCDGECPPGQICTDVGNECGCEEVQPPTCADFPYPQCNGTCPPGMGTCEPIPDTQSCDCVQPVPCDLSAYPTCDGDCPPGEYCSVGPNQNCDCLPLPQCGDPGDYPICEEYCPPGLVCEPVPGTQDCDCVEQFPACEDTVYPTCNGVCPPGEKCLNLFGTDDCRCEPPPPVCGAALYPGCEGECPVDERCVAVEAPVPGCECQPCAGLGTSGLGGISIGWPSTKDQLRWTGAEECALVYNTYRFTGPVLPDADQDGLADDYGTCYVSDIIGLDVVDQSSPPPGQIHWYLVTGENFVAEGSLGENSAQVERPNLAPCP